MINEEFLISISEHNVSRYNPDKMTYIITSDQIQINGEEIKGDIVDKISRIKSLINSRKNEIEAISNSSQSNYKGGVQKMLSIVIGEKKYGIIGNTSNEEAAKLYRELKEEIEKIIK